MSIVFCDPASQVTQCHFQRIVFVEAVKSPAQAPGEEIHSPFLDGKSVKEFTDVL